MATLANGLTDDDQYGSFEIANVIWTDTNTATIQNGFGVMLTLNQLDSLQADLTARLLALSTASAARVHSLVTQWNTVRTDTATMAAGGVKDVTGLTYDPEGYRNQIKRLFCTYVPCMGMAIAQARKNDAKPIESNTTEIMRG